MESREKEMLIVHLFFDLVIINMAIVLTASHHFGISAWEFKSISQYLLHANLSWVITYFVFVKKNGYLRNDFLNRLLRISKRMIIFLIVAMVIAFMMMPQDFSRSFILQYILVINIAKVFFYFILHRYLRFKRRMKIDYDNCIIVDSGKTGQMLKATIQSNPLLGYRFEGFVCDDFPENGFVVGRTDELSEIIDRLNIQVVFVVISFFWNSNKTRDYLRICNNKGIHLYFVPVNQRWFANMSNAETIGDIVLFNPQKIPLDDVGLRIQKRIFDVLFSSMVIIFVFTWLFPIIAIIIKATSRGPIFFNQERTGVNNRVFKCLKFRSMRVNVDSDKKQATVGDARITPIGRFMRRTNIDELPQFINVLMGTMSVVGPRPHMLRHTVEYSALIKEYKVRHYVKPGITGWAQVNGYRGETTEVWKMERRVECDMEYIQNWTFSWDIKIIWLTVFGKHVFKNAG